jgi:hypothetical protein
MTQADIQANLTSHTLAVEHIRISSSRTFAEVRRKLEATLPKLDANIAGALSSGKACQGLRRYRAKAIYF